MRNRVAGVGLRGARCGFRVSSLQGKGLLLHSVAGCKQLGGEERLKSMGSSASLPCG